MNTLSLPTMLAERLIREDYRVAITGASGWLGRACVEMLFPIFPNEVATRLRCFGGTARTLRLRTGEQIGQLPLSVMESLERRPTLLLHFACLTKEKVSSMSLEDYIRVNRGLTRATLGAAERIGVDRVFFVSSGAVYRAMSAPAGDLGSQIYGTVKLEDEAAFERFSREQDGRRVVTARLFNLSGPYINKPYALASFIDQARGGCINITASHPVIRSYVGVENLLAVALSQLMGDAADAHLRFDTAGEREVEVQELAEVVKSTVNPQANIRRPEFSQAAVDRYVGDGALYYALASRHGIDLHHLQRQIRDTADYQMAWPCLQS